MVKYTPTTVKLDDGRVAKVLTPTLTSRSVQVCVFDNKTGRYETKEIYSSDPLYQAITGNNKNFQYYQDRIASEEKLLEHYQDQAKLYKTQTSIFDKLYKTAKNKANSLMHEAQITSSAEINKITDAEKRKEIVENLDSASVNKSKKTAASSNEYSSLISAFLQVFHLGKAKQEQMLFA